MSASEIVLIDLSSIAYPIYMKSGSEPDVDFTSREIVARVRGLTAAHPKAAICCDKGKSFRHELEPTYKANRPEKEAALHHQIALAVERLQADGYPVWAVKGFEADDLIASAVAQAIKCEASALVVSADKDLLQLVGQFGENGERTVRVMSPATGTIYDREAVKAKFDVWPEQVRDYLCLVGDASDNVRGAQGIGPKKAAELLGRYGNLEAVYEALDNHGTQFKPAMATSLREFQPRLAAVRQLITLRTDVEIPFAELDNERQAVDAAPMEGLDMEAVEERAEILAAAPVVAEVVDAKPAEPVTAAAAQGHPTAPVVAEAPKVNGNGKGLDIPATAAPVALMPFERQLEPQSLGQAAQLANHLHAAKMFNAYGSPQAVLSTILAGRELGLQAIASLRAFHVIEGKHAPSADLLRALVLRSGQAKYFRCVERSASSVTFETHRHGEPEPVRLTYTIEEGRAAFKPELPQAEREKKWASSGWGKYPANMLTARAGAMLARLVYPDVVFGLYAPAELTDDQAA